METISGILDNKGTPLEKQKFTWKEMAGKPISKLDDDAFTRVRIILMNGVETDALRLKHGIARFNKELRLPLAEIRRVEQHQATMVNWLIGADHSPLETTVAYEQVAIEVTAAVAQNEPDPYQAQTYRFGLLEDFDHLYRYSAMLDRLEGKDANNILQGYTDIVPGRKTSEHHRHPENDIRDNYEKNSADPLARQLYAEIASVEEQHVTQYGSLSDPSESHMEKWLVHEAMEVYMYASCAEQETNPRIKAMWERFLDYELGHLNVACERFKKLEGRDPAEVLAGPLPKMVEFKSQRDFVRQVLAAEVNLRTAGPAYVDKAKEPQSSLDYRNHLASEGLASDIVSAGYQWAPGGELMRKAS